MKSPRAANSGAFRSATLGPSLSITFPFEHLPVKPPSDLTQERSGFRPLPTGPSMEGLSSVLYGENVMTIDSFAGGPSTDDRQLVYARMGMSSNAIRHVESMVSACPARKPGKAALTNVVVQFASPKNQKSRVLESHTCEQVYAHELELDPTVIGYYAQVPCRGVQRTLPNGRRHVSAACLDFLVFRQNTVELVECKHEDWLQTESAKNNSDWQRMGDRWAHLPYEAFAQEHELRFVPWSPPQTFGVYLQNLEAICAVRRDEMGRLAQKAIEHATRKLRLRPASLSELCNEIDGFDARLALWMLGNALAFGPLKSTPLELTTLFTLCQDREQAQLIDGRGLESCRATYAQDRLSDPLLLASTTDLAKGRERLARLRAIERGEDSSTVRMRQLSREVAEAVAQGRNPLEACLTSYRTSGNRGPRLLDEQEQAAAAVIATQWNTGRVHRECNLYFCYEEECAKYGVRAAGKSAFYDRVRKESPTKHALSTGGLRGYQAIRTATDPSKRSLPPIGYGHTLHIDSSDFDNRTAINLAELMPASKAKFYVGLDGSTVMPMAHALIFGPARTDGLAILLREYVRRHGFLPRVIHLDRGPENRSLWIVAFAEAYQISLRWSPTAGSVWNGIAENAIKQINDQVAHQLIGSTEPDQKGRKVDGRFKSYRNAKTSFAVVREQFLAFVYEDLPRIPRADGRTPLEKKQDAIAFIGEVGRPCECNEDLLLRTSIDVDIKKSVDPRRGVRTEDGYFTSDDLVKALRFHRVETVSSDCEDPTVLRVRIGGAWIKTFHSRVQSMAVLPPEEKLFDLLYGPIRRAHARDRKGAISRIHHRRIQLANAATLSAVDTSRAAHEEPAAAAHVTSAAEVTLPDPRRALWDDLQPISEQGVPQ
jgi:putative transposase